MSPILTYDFLVTLAHLCARLLDASTRKNASLPVGAILTLLFIDRYPGISRTEIERVTGMSPNASVNSLDWLLACDLVIRTLDDDGRTQKLTLSDAGVALLDDLPHDGDLPDDIFRAPSSIRWRKSKTTQDE